MKRTGEKNSYFRKILLALLTVNMVPILFLGVSIANMVKRQSHMVNQNMVSMADNEVRRIERNFQSVEKALIELSLDSDMALILRTELLAKNFQIFNRMRGRLQRIVTTAQNVDDIFVMNQNKGWIVSASLSTRTEHYPEIRKIQELYEIPRPSGWYTDEDYIYLVKHLPINTLPGVGMVMARFSKNAIALDHQDNDAGHAIVVLDGDMKWIYGEDEQYKVVRDAVDSEPWEEIGEEGSFQTSFRGESYILTVQKSDYNGWIYVMVTPNSIFVKSMHSVFLMLLVTLTGMVIADVYVIYIGSKRLYLPIGELDNMAGRMIPEHDLEVFDKVKYLLNQNKEMAKNRKVQEISRQQLFLRQVYQGEADGVTEADFVRTQVTQQKLNGTNLYMAAVKFKEEFETDEDWNLYMFALSNVIEELLDSSLRLPLVTMGRVTYAVCSVDGDSTEVTDLRMQTMASMCIQAVREYLKVMVNVGISSSFCQVGQLSQAFKECEKALRDVMGFSGACNFYQVQKDPEGSRLWSQAGQERKRILKAIDLGDYENCRQNLDDYLRILKDMKYYRFKLELAGLLSELIGIYETYALTPDSEKVEDMLEYDMGKKVNSFEILRQYLMEYLIEPLFMGIHEKKNQNDIIYQITHYLNENLEQNINLEECARYFNYNPNYLSRMFKKNFGKTYTDYVTERKMERCKELLLQTDISVGELAERFGYSSAQNFIRVFKKYTLVTPGQFRKQQKEKEEDKHNETG